MRARVFQPRRLDVVAFARADGVLDGSQPLRELPRLAAGLLSTSDAPANVSWHLAGGMRRVDGAGASATLHMVAHASAPMQCQRCLTPVTVLLHVDRHFVFVPDEALAVRLDDDSDDDFLVLSRDLDLLELLEDELILSLPIVPRHDDCMPPAQDGQTSGDVDIAQGELRRNPFDVLEALRRR